MDLDDIMNITDNSKGLRCCMNETSAPLPERMCIFPRIKEDIDFEKEIIKKYGLTTKEDNSDYDQ